MAKTLDRAEKERLTQLLAQFRKIDLPGADRRGHKDFDDRELLLDNMQTLLGLGMVMPRDIITRAEKVLAGT